MKKIFTFGCLITVLFFYGCASSRLPERLSALSIKRVKSIDLPYNVIVEEYKFPAYSESLETNLKHTGIFKSVDGTMQSSTQTLVAKVEDRIHGTAGFPIWTILTLGIIPTFVDEDHGDSFSLCSPDNPEEKVNITYRYRSTSVLGWYGLFLNLHPDWWLAPEKTQRYLDSLSYAIAAKAESIKTLNNKKRRKLNKKAVPNE